MGSYLDKPETTKKSALDENEIFLIGSSSMQVRNAVDTYGNMRIQ